MAYAGRERLPSRDYGIQYKQVDLLESGEPDIPAIKEAVKGAKLAHWLSVPGYSLGLPWTVEKNRGDGEGYHEVSPDNHRIC